MTYKSSDSGVEYVRLMAENGFIRKNIISDEETTVRYQKLESEGSPLPEGVYPRATPHKDHLLDFARVLLAYFPSSFTIRPSKATALRRPHCTI